VTKKGFRDLAAYETFESEAFSIIGDNGRAACPQAAERRVGDNAPYQNAVQVFEAYAKNELGADKDFISPPRIHAKSGN
jgi:hypothetical protein